MASYDEDKYARSPYLGIFGRARGGGRYRITIPTIIAVC